MVPSDRLTLPLEADPQVRPTPRRMSSTGRCCLAITAVLVLLASCGSPRPSPARSATAPEATTSDNTSSDGATCAGPGSLNEAAAPFASSEAGRVVVYLPGCYDASPLRRFPVLYLLHGAGADASQWPDVGLASAADSAIATGAIGPLIVVMPDGGAEMPDSLIDGLIERLLPWTDHSYRTIATSHGRAVGGISRGGRIALLAAAQHPDLFTAAGGHSPALTGKDATDAVAAGLALLGRSVAVDVGDNDPLRSGVEAFAAQAMADTPVTVWPGRHDRHYWSDHVADYLGFYGSRLEGSIDPPPG